MTTIESASLSQRSADLEMLKGKSHIQLEVVVVSRGLPLILVGGLQASCLSARGLPGPAARRPEHAAAGCSPSPPAFDDGCQRVGFQEELLQAL